MGNRTVIFLVICAVLICAGCRKGENKYTAREPVDADAMINANRFMVKKDQERIRAYIKENRLNLHETESGLWYDIGEKGSGNKARKGQSATIKYDVSLIDGTRCYDSDSLGLKSFRIGQGGVESGLEEGILMLRQGDRAIFIMPPHLAHGLTGDGNRIPSRSIIIYHVELVKLEP